MRTKSPQNYAGNDQPYHVAERLLVKGLSIVMRAGLRNMLKLQQKRNLEFLLTLKQAPNNEPQKRGAWRKVPFEERHFNTVEGNVPAENWGMEEEEKARVMSTFKLGDDGGPNENRWIYPEGIMEMKAWSSVVEFDNLGKDNKNYAAEAFTPVDSNTEVRVRDTWGFDCACYRSIELVIGNLEPVEERLSPAQTRWFIEGILRSSINAQDKHESI